MANKAAPNDRDEVSPKEVLFAFFAAMCRWERYAFRRTEKVGEAEDDALLEGRNRIITEYCTPKRRVYSEPLSFGDPPEYDPRASALQAAVG